MIDYKPYPYQRTFHELGRAHPFRLLHHANLIGATTMCAHEIAYHFAGAYPDWWQGARFDPAETPTRRTLIAGPDIDYGRPPWLMERALKNAGVADADLRTCGVYAFEVDEDAAGKPDLLGCYEVIWVEQFPTAAEHDALCDALVPGGVMMLTGTPLGRPPAYLGEYRRSPRHAILGVGVSSEIAHLDPDYEKEARPLFPKDEQRPRFDGDFDG